MSKPPGILRRLFKRKAEAPEEPAVGSEPSADEVAIAKARAYLEQVRQKMERLAEDFAAGRVNPTQFQELYAHYQRERKVVMEALEETPEAAAWRAAAATGESVIIRRRHAARILGYAIYLNASGAPIRTVGEYHVDARLLASMLDSFRSNIEEALERQIHSLEIEHGRWVGFVPGQYTTLVVLFSVEPARAQLDMLRDLQAHFERANQQQFARGITDPAQLVFPHAVVFE
ncbi:MAG TPA: hypothetical protein G4N97_00560 [Thermoflexia bacterium]|nr:MAG: hypothetical protein DRI80_00390 [Chloroflexota bacterium]HEY66747.1 hypothetical protein [Thermoflexia bacterium]